MQHGLILLRVPKRRQTLGAQKNQRHAPCPQKSNRTAVGLSRPSTSCFCGAKNVDHRDIGAKQSFVASPGDDEKWMAGDKPGHDAAVSSAAPLVVPHGEERG